jgi:hypothetical protein
VPFLTDYGFFWQQQLLRGSIVLDLAMCVTNSYLNFNGRLGLANDKLCND